MKRILALLLVISLLCSSFSVTFAVDYREQALLLLAENLQVSPETINLDGSVVDLPLTGQQFWAGRYYIGDEPTENHAVDDFDETVSFDPSSGIVYLDLKTGELLTFDKVQPFFDEEEKLRQAEFERLTQQAGKIDPYFYEKIINAGSGELFEAVIWLIYVETASIKTAMEKIIREYPEFEGGVFSVEPDRCTDYPGEPSANTIPGSAGGGETGISSGQTEGIPVIPDQPDQADDLVFNEEYRILPYPGPDTEPVPGEDFCEKEPGIADNTDWLRFEEMMGRLAEVRAGGYAASQAALTKALDDMGVTYEVMEGNNAVLCELTTSQLMLLKEADYIESIGEEMIACMDTGMERNAAAQGEDTGSSGQTAAPWMLATVLLLLAGCGAYYYFLRKKKNPADNIQMK